MIQADALALPFRSESVDLIIANPPYPGNGVWIDDYLDKLAQAKAEMRRVLKLAGAALVLQRIGEPIRPGQQPLERWVYFPKQGKEEDEGPGRTIPPPVKHGRYWNTLVEADVIALIWKWSKPGGIVLDPFGGTGQVAMLADEFGRLGISSDISWRQAQLAGWRLSQV